MNECNVHGLAYTKYCETCKTLLCTQCVEAHLTTHSTVLSLESAKKLYNNEKELYRTQLCTLETKGLKRITEELEMTEKEVKVLGDLELQKVLEEQRARVLKLEEIVKQGIIEEEEDWEKIIERVAKFDYSSIFKEAMEIENKLVSLYSEIKHRQIISLTEEYEKAKVRLDEINAEMAKKVQAEVDFNKEIKEDKFKEILSLKEQDDNLKAELDRKKAELVETEAAFAEIKANMEQEIRSLGNTKEELMKQNNALKQEKSTIEDEIGRLKSILAQLKTVTQEESMKKDDMMKSKAQSKETPPKDPQVVLTSAKSSEESFKEDQAAGLPLAGVIPIRKELSAYLSKPDLDSPAPLTRKNLATPAPVTAEKSFPKKSLFSFKSPPKLSEEVKHLFKPDISLIKRNSEKCLALEQTNCAVCGTGYSFKVGLILYCGHRGCTSCVENICSNNSYGSLRSNCLVCNAEVPVKTVQLSCGCEGDLGNLKFVGFGENASFRFMLNESKEDYVFPKCKAGHTLSLDDLYLIHGNAAKVFMIHHIKPMLFQNLSAHLKTFKGTIEVELRNALISLSEFKELGMFLFENEEKIRKLDLSRNRLSDDIMRNTIDILSRAKTLEELDMQDNQLGDKGFGFLAEGLLKSKSIKMLNLKSNNPGKSGFKAIEKFLKGNHTIKRLNLSLCTLTQTGAEYLAEGLKKNEGLVELNIDKNIIGDKGFGYIAKSLKHNKSLRILSAESNEISAAGIKVLSESAKAFTTLRKLSLKKNKVGKGASKALGLFLATCQPLTEFDISYNVLVEDSWEFFAEGLIKNKSLQALDISGNILKDKGLISLAKGLKGNSTLKTLIMEDSSLGFEGIKQFCNTLSFNNCLQELVISRNVLVDEAAKCLSLGLQLLNSITKFHAKECKLTETGMKHILMAARHKELLADFCITEATFSPKLSRNLGDVLALNKNLLRLHLDHCGIGIEGAIELADALKSAPKIETLILIGNGIKDKGVMHIFQALAKNETVKSIDLRTNGLTDLTIQYLELALTTNLKLENVNLSGNHIREEGLLNLEKVKRTNSYLDIICANLTQLQYHIIHIAQSTHLINYKFPEKAMMKVYIHLRANELPQVLYTLKYECTPDSTFADLEKFIYSELDKVNVFFYSHAAKVISIIGREQSLQDKQNPSQSLVLFHIFYQQRDRNTSFEWPCSVVCVFSL
eukprot:TRINITY_DN64345_c0_g1_i1.p1 TRINITY_DN64345_c0_g1~~TRINITY_DN64345_c0_g1_i1.p1  ORF type:complete len:1194 (-),score=140.36 TRINITY_DN64345_c0_g1_i1:1102-4683(-)